MTKYEYLAELERLLSALPEQERRDAMNYYEEYFVSAGPDKEAETIRKLGTPQEVARKILEEAGINPDTTPGGSAPYYTQPQPKQAGKKPVVWIVILVVLVVLAILAIALWSFTAFAFGRGTGYRRTMAAASTVEPEIPVSSAQPQPTAAAGTGNGTDNPGASATSSETAADGSLYLGADLRKLEMEVYNVDLNVVMDQNAAEPVLTSADLPQAQIALQQARDGEVQLSLGERTTRSFGANAGANTAVYTVTLTLPASLTLQELDIEVHQGSAVLQDLTAQDIGLDVGAGDLVASSLTANEVSLEVGSGAADISAISANSTSIDVGSGDVNIAGLTADMASLELGSGSLTVSQAQLTRAGELENGSGDLQLALAGQSADYTLTAELSPSGQFLYDGQSYTDPQIRGQGTGTVRLEAENGSGNTTVQFLG